MVFKFSNVGIVEKAEIELKGLTVITGLNDTGKSFISKSIYSIIKTLKDSNARESNEKTNQLDQLWIDLRSWLNHLKRPEILALFEQIILPLRAEVLTELSSKIPVENIVNKIRAKQQEIIDKDNFTPEFIKGLNLRFDNVVKIISNQKNEEDIRLSYFNRIIIQQLFRSQFNSLGKIASERKSSIIWKEGDSEIIKVVIDNNKTIEFKANSSQSNFTSFQDATIIDSPIILQLQNLILKHRLEISRGLEVPMPIYYSDLVSKFIPLGTPSDNKIHNIIKGVIKGDVVYDEKLNKIIFRKSNGFEIDGINIANGIKSFGIIQLLLNSGAINKNSILIIDEPEVHLHPQWEVEYATIIVTLCKADIPIIISSHSPYLIETISKLSKHNGIEDMVKFYFGKELSNGFTSFEDVTANLTPIFKALADPMKRVANL